LPEVLVPGRERVSFSRIPEVLPLPDLIGIQRQSFDWLLRDGLAEVLAEVSPIEDFTETYQLIFGKHQFKDIKYSVEECKDKDMTYSAPLFVEAQFINKETGEIKEQEVFMGDFPMMTDKGTFVINGTERVVVSQLVRSPGVYFSRELDKTSDKDIFTAKVIPSRGAWLEFEVDKRDTVGVRIDRKRRQNVTVLLKALGWSEEEILDLFEEAPSIRATLEKDHFKSQEEALEDIYRKLRPGEPPTAESAQTLLENLFFNPKRYDLAKVGRYKILKKLGQPSDVARRQLKSKFDSMKQQDNPDKRDWDQTRWRVFAEPYGGEKDKLAPGFKGILTHEDVIKAVQYLVKLHAGEDGYEVDDIDHFGNRRVRAVGELIQNQVRLGLTRMERVVRERMTTQDVEAITPQTLINIRPVVAAIKEFFGTSQLSQFMDQTNPLAGLTHKRRLSALGPGGLSRERAGFEVRDVHPSHYGRMCPIETPEGPNIGLIGTLSTYGRINEFGFVETPYRKVVNGRVSDQIDYLTADEEDRHVIAQANTPVDPRGRFTEDRVLVRRKGGEVDYVPPTEVDYMDVSPKQIVSVAAALIPFLEHDDANRALMGANMQRQAVPLLRSEAPLIGTGVEFRAAVDAGDVILAEQAGMVEEVGGYESRDNEPAQEIVIRSNKGELKTYKLLKFRRSNQGTCISHKPIVRVGDKVRAGQVIADGPSTEQGELALGRNLLVAFMPWEGHNYEDAIVISERLIKDDVLTSIHIEEHEVDARDTKLGPEEITRDIPNVSEEILKDLDERGIVRIGAEVNPGDYLVGKVTPKGETELTPEERLLRAIFGEKAREVRDTSLKMRHGESGKVIGVRVFSRDAGDELAPGVNELVRVYVAQKRKISDGDKLAGRHGNKGVIAKILPEEDMPFLPDGTPTDIVLNPLGVPSRMNLGQVLEAHLGWAARVGFRSNGKRHAGGAVGGDGAMFVASPVFDGAREGDILGALETANSSPEGLELVNGNGKSMLFDGRTGEPFDVPVTVGYIYIMKLLHLVDDKIHARSTGPYSMITQQPLGGKAQFGGQRFGEMEVWALEAYGAAYALQELLTIKSDDVLGRVKVYEAIVKGENIPEPGIPESFKVLIKEMQSLCLNVEVLSAEGKEIEMRETDEDVFRAAEELGIDLSRREPAGADFD
jgi:DNA-directed RNA polymerase subunit beta